MEPKQQKLKKTHLGFTIFRWRVRLLFLWVNCIRWCRGNTTKFSSWNNSTYISSTHQIQIPPYWKQSFFWCNGRNPRITTLLFNVWNCIDSSARGKFSYTCHCGRNRTSLLRTFRTTKMSRERVTGQTQSKHLKKLWMEERWCKWFGKFDLINESSNYTTRVADWP